MCIPAHSWRNCIQCSMSIGLNFVLSSMQVPTLIISEWAAAKFSIVWYKKSDRSQPEQPWWDTMIFSTVVSFFHCERNKLANKRCPGKRAFIPIPEPRNNRTVVQLCVPRSTQRKSSKRGEIRRMRWSSNARPSSENASRVQWRATWRTSAQCTDNEYMTNGRRKDIFMATK